MNRIGSSLECTHCKRMTTIMNKSVFERGDVVRCKYCPYSTIILDECLANPDKIDTSGLTKQVLFANWIIDEFITRGMITLFSNPQQGTGKADTFLLNLLIKKYNHEHPDDIITY